jgi:hypothetical protein
MFQMVKKEKPETAKQLIDLMQQHHAIPPKQTTNLLIEMENENRLHFTRQISQTPLSLSEYIFSKQTSWYWTTIALAAATSIIVFAIPETELQLVYLRSSLGIIFVLFLPGFTLIKALFPAKVTVRARSEYIDQIELVALSFGMSMALVPLIGLVLNFSPFGIRITPITLSLLALTVVFATTAIVREHQTKTGSNPAKH